MIKIDENVWTFLKQHLDYSDEELTKFRADSRNEEVLKRAADLMSKTIVAEVIHSHGCNSQHKVGDKFYLDGVGNLISDLCPKKMCLHAVSALKSPVFAANELLYAGVDPNKMLFKRCGCSDVGLECGGWGRVILEISVQERNKE
jgi:uncharacterized repeat protein (TIGR04076 family)